MTTAAIYGKSLGKPLFPEDKVNDLHLKCKCFVFYLGCGQKISLASKARADLRRPMGSRSQKQPSARGKDPGGCVTVKASAALTQEICIYVQQLFALCL